MSQQKPIDVKHCAGCVDDFYNGKNDLGVAQCWQREGAEIVKRLLIHVDDPPPYKHLKAQNVPNCYKRKRYVTVKPEAIGKDGYWK